MDLALAIMPLVLTLATGWALVASNFLPKTDWRGVEILSFRLLIPVMLVQTISRAELSYDQFGAYALALLSALALVSVVVLLIRPFVSHTVLPNPSFTTLFQTTTRTNGFIALAAAELVVGQAGVALIAVAFAVMIPPINVANITVLTIFGTGKARVGTVVLTILKNPLIIGASIGLAINLTGADMPRAIEGAVDLISRATLGVGLLAVGAGISLRRLLKPSVHVVMGLVLRLIIGPAVFLGIAHVFGLTQVQTLCGMFMLAVPAASNGYVVAKQMGGNAELYADILTWQTILSLAMLPFLAAFLMA